MIVKIPPEVDSILQILTENGFDAVAVGGCVRDGLLGKTPKDWDVATSAVPEETKRALAGYKIFETGLKHGTLTVLFGAMPIEVTTYRVDGTYSDGRRPDRVTFTRLLKEDLSRRDFTINAMALRRDGVLVDEFGGQKDLSQKIVRCVGDPDRRFREDGLRILRALRFASALDFTIDADTSRSLKENRAMLDGIAKERIRTEFVQLLCGPGAERILGEYREVVARFIPEIAASFGFAQNNPHHIYDVWEHTLKTVSAVAPNPILRVTMLLHDLGKSFCYTEDKNGIRHFYGHATRSAELAEAILRRLRFDRRTAETITLLVRRHDLSLPDDERILKRRLNLLGEENLRRLLQVRAADTLAKSPQDREKLVLLERTKQTLERILDERQCFSLKELAVSGGDLIAAGVPEGAELGKALDALLGAVIDGECPNERDALLEFARHRKDLDS